MSLTQRKVDDRPEAILWLSRKWSTIAINYYLFQIVIKCECSFKSDFFDVCSIATASLSF